MNKMATRKMHTGQRQVRSMRLAFFHHSPGSILRPFFGVGGAGAGTGTQFMGSPWNPAGVHRILQSCVVKNEMAHR